MHAIAAAFALLLLAAGCATTPQTEAATPECTRFTAATRAYGKVFNPVDMQNKAVEACGRGDPYACVSAPAAVPYTSLLAIAGVPLVFPVFLASDNVYRNECPQSGHR